MAGMDVDQPGAVPGVGESLFSNAVVWRTLGKCLSLSDLKACRLVCKDFNKNVMDTTDFRSRGTVKLKVEHMRPEEFGNTRENWKKVSLPIFEDSSEDMQAAGQDWLCPLLREVEFLTLRSDLSYMKDRMPAYIEALTQAPEKLQCLVIDPRLLSKHDVNVLKSSQHVLSNLSSLEIKEEDCRPTSFVDLNSREYSLQWIAMSATSLTEFKARSVIPEDLENILDHVDEGLTENMQPILRIVENNRSRIQVLELDDLPFWAAPTNADLKYVGDWVFPALRKVKIRASQIEWEQVGKFLQAQPPLEELDITILNQFPNGLLEVIRRKGERLKKLHVKTKGFEDTEDNMWTFLQGLPLEEFNLVLIHSGKCSLNCEYAPVVFNSLPSSIKSVTLRGLPIAWDVNGSLTAANFANINPMTLTVLNLSQCGAVITDETVENVCRQLKMMRELNLSNADERCTDYGFTGIRLGDDTPAFSISDLKGLKSLTLRSCGVISDQTLRLGIRFLELRFLDVSHNSNLTMEGYIEVLKHNPSLEVLRTTEVDEFPPVEDLQKYGCSRLKHHEFSYAGDSDDEDASVYDSRSISGGGSFDRDLDVDEDGYDDYCDDFDDSDDDWVCG